MVPVLFYENFYKLQTNRNKENPNRNVLKGVHSKKNNGTSVKWRVPFNH